MTSAKDFQPRHLHNSAHPSHLSTPSGLEDYGFEKSDFGLTYIGPLAEFPEQFVRQAIWCFVQKLGPTEARTLIDRELAIFRHIR